MIISTKQITIAALKKPTYFILNVLQPAAVANS